MINKPTEIKQQLDSFNLDQSRSYELFELGSLNYEHSQIEYLIDGQFQQRSIDCELRQNNSNISSLISSQVVNIMDHAQNEIQSDLYGEDSLLKQKKTREDDLILQIPKKTQKSNQGKIEVIKQSLNIQKLSSLFQENVFVENNQQRKNPNFTKFLLSSFNKEMKRLKKSNLISQQHLKLYDKAKQQYERNGRRNIQMNSLNLLFGEIQQTKQFVSTNRMLLHNLLGRKSFKKYVHQNPFAQEINKKQHLLASKVYRLRCRSGKLTGRTQTK